MTSNKMDLLERLERSTVLCAEGYVFELERRGYLKAGAFVPEVVLDHPEAVKELHREFLRAGSEVMMALTYYAHRDKLRVIGRENDLEKLNRRALRLAKEAAAEGNALLAGNICNTWVYSPENHEETSEIVRSMYQEQVGWAKEEGADFIVAETMGYLGEALIALDVIKSAGLPAVVTLAACCDTTKDGYSWEAACRTLEEGGADVVGLNCTRGPATMIPLLKKIRKSVEGYVAALPVPYRTTTRQPIFQSLKENGHDYAFPLNLEHFLCTRSEMADFAIQAQKIGINYIGICCGGAPHHVRSMAEALGRRVPASKYSPDMSRHSMLGSDDVVREDHKQFLKEWEAVSAVTED
ncbi:MAG: homocysteine S-methyltransferase family protein [Euryarchaeota archaeon]|nr:homocysteine S-methyltransferase family protein [Euryarchaeota archaeon]